MNADFENMAAYLSKINWDYEFSFVFTVEDYWSLFASHLFTCIELFVPKRNMYKRTVRIKKKSSSLLEKNIQQESCAMEKVEDYWLI